MSCSLRLSDGQSDQCLVRCDCQTVGQINVLFVAIVRRSVGPAQLPPVGPGSTQVLHTMHDGRRWQPRLVRLQEQGAHHQPSGHEYRGERMDMIMYAH